MKLNSKFFNKSLILETKQMDAIKGGHSYTQIGSNNAGQSNSTRDWKSDSSSSTGTWCYVPDNSYPGGNLTL